ncbi:MAG: aldehyde dehydrogenase family protein [Janthinobacterium lividum]
MQLPGSTAIQCYCPANGKLLGRVNPTTADGIDRAVAKAQEAQTQWSKTTFSQRRLVLKTLLKSVRRSNPRLYGNGD